MNGTIDPAILSAADAALIRAHAAAGEADGIVTPEVLDLVHERGWLRMLAPRECGGLGFPLPQAVRLEEALAAADGSLGWFVTLCAGAGWFAGFLAPDSARALVATPALCVAGSGAVNGFADLAGSGYRLQGRWDYATGAPVATHFTLNAVLREDGEILRDAEGKPRVRAFIVPAQDVDVEQTWAGFGMRAAASHAFRVDGVFAAGEQAFDIQPEAATFDAPLYRFPFMPLAYVTLAANLSGMAHNFLELSRPVIATRRHPLHDKAVGEFDSVRQACAHAMATLLQARAAMLEKLDAAWACVEQGAAIPPEEVTALQDAALALAITAVRSSDTVYPYCGLAAARTDSEIGRAWRDLHTACQHALLVPTA